MGSRGYRYEKKKEDRSSRIFFQAEDSIRDSVASRGLGDVYKVQAVYGARNEERLTGLHETCSINDFRYGVSDRGASIRIPMQTSKDGYGYLEDRRPSANMDPYLVCAALVETTCG